MLPPRRKVPSCSRAHAGASIPREMALTKTAFESPSFVPKESAAARRMTCLPASELAHYITRRAFRTSRTWACWVSSPSCDLTGIKHHPGTRLTVIDEDVVDWDLDLIGDARSDDL